MVHVGLIGTCMYILLQGKYLLSPILRTRFTRVYKVNVIEKVGYCDLHQSVGTGESLIHLSNPDQASFGTYMSCYHCACTVVTLFPL